MSRPSNAWRNKSSKRKVRVKLISSLHVKLPYKPSPEELRGMLVASYHLLMGQACTCPTHLPYHKEPPLLTNHLPQWLLLLWCLSIPLGPSGNTPRPSGQHVSWWDHIKGNLGRAPQLQMVRDSTFIQGANMELLRSIQLGHQSSEGD